MRLRRVPVGIVPIVALMGVAFAAVAIVHAPPVGADSVDVTETRSVAPFVRIRVEGATDTEVVVGKPFHVTVTAPRDVLAGTTMAVTDGTLVIGNRAGREQHGTVKLAIAVPTLLGFENAGAGKARLAGFSGGNLSIANDGAASIDASGRVATLALALSGVGRIDATELAARDATVDNNGVGSIWLRATASLTMNVNGVGEIRYAGHPANVESHVNGVGHIERL